MPDSNPTLLGLDYSPWTEKCRWALDHHGVAYHYEQYTPMIGEPALRLKLRRLRGLVSVPVLFTREGALTESWDIAQYAERMGGGSPLFPAEHAAVIRHWNDRGQQVAALGRKASISRTMNDDASLTAQMDAAPAPMRPVLKPMAPIMVRIFAAKYARDTPAEGGMLRAALLEWREALGGRATLFDTVTYADLVMATALQFFAPVAERYIVLDPRIRPTWCDAELAEEFADLVAWRDGLYETHRRPRS